MCGNEIACDSYSVPSHIRDHIDIILPTVNFDSKVLPRENSQSLARRAGRKGASISPFAKTDGRKPMDNDNPADSLANCDVNITPACLRALYNFHYTPVATHLNSYGIGWYFLVFFIICYSSLCAVEYTPQGGNSPRLSSFLLINDCLHSIPPGGSRFILW
jgi:hypothetical protein